MGEVCDSEMGDCVAEEVDCEFDTELKDCEAEDTEVDDCETEDSEGD